MQSNLSADDVIRILKMAPHPEGGHFVETFRDSCEDSDRPRSTAIYYLLGRNERSHWHRIDSAEIWHYYAGSPLELEISKNGSDSTQIRLGPNLAAGERPQGIVPPGAWQAANSCGAWTLVGCTVAPGFEFESFELAAPDWRPALNNRVDDADA